MKPAQSELIILKHLWRLQPQSVGEIHSAIKVQLNWSRSSTKKTIERMLDKDMLLVEDVHGIKVYRAMLKKVPTLAKIIRQFTAEVLGLDGPLPVANLVTSDLFNEEELAELDEYLKKIEQSEG